MWSDFENDYAYEMYHDRLDGIWTMRDGTEIAVTDMTTSHIRNCMRMVGKNHGWYAVFADELERRGEKV
jgi:hypothetical protein